MMVAAALCSKASSSPTRLRASASSRSTVSPTVRQGALAAAPFPPPRPSPARGEGERQRLRPRPVPRLRKVAIERIEAEPQIVGERAQQRGISASPAAARHARQRHQRLRPLPPARPFARAHAARRGSAAPSGRRYARRALPARVAVALQVEAEVAGRSHARAARSMICAATSFARRGSPASAAAYSSISASSSAAAP